MTSRALITGITGQDGSYLAELLLEKGFVLGAERYDGADPVNLGVGREITIRELVELIARLTGVRGEIRWDPSKPDGQPRRALDTSRAQKRFGFVTLTSFEEGLRRTIEYYENWGRKPA